MNTRNMTGVWLEDMMGRLFSKEMEFVNLGEELYQEAMDLWAVHDNDDALVAAQLYPDDDEQTALAKTQEARAALEGAHRTHETFDWAAFRRVANFTRSRMGG